MTEETNMGPGVHKILHLMIVDICKEVDLPYRKVEEIVCSWDNKKDDRLVQTCPVCDNRVLTL